MKKLILALVIVALFAGVACADGLTQDPNKRLKSLVITADGAVTALGTNDLILGVSVGGAASVQGCLYNTTAAGSCTTALSVAEAESSTGSTVAVWFPYGIAVPSASMYALVDGTGATLTIYYEDR